MDFIEKIKHVSKLTLAIENKSYGTKYEGGKRKMAMALQFEAQARKLGMMGEDIKKNDPSDEVLEKFEKQMDYLIELHNRPEDFWDIYLVGENPKKISFSQIGREQLKFINLQDVEEVKISKILSDWIK